MNLGEFIGWTVLTVIAVGTVAAYSYLFRLWWRCRKP